MKRSLCIYFFIISSLIHNYAYCMEELTEKKEIAASTKIQFFELKPISHLSDNHIPGEIKGALFDVMSFKSKSLKEGAHFINLLSGTCKTLNKLINENMLSLIKKLSDNYKCSNVQAAEALQMTIASDIFMKQIAFESLCGQQKLSRAEKLHIKKSNIDINFTYGYEGWVISSQLIGACLLSSVKTKIAKFLIKNGADINFADGNGITAPWHEAQLLNLDGRKKYILEYFFNHPDFNINEIREYSGKKQTLLMRVIDGPIWAMPPKELASMRLPLIEKMCLHGADPELAPNHKNGDFTCALSMAKEIGDEDLIKVFEETIAKKHIKS